jgi:hypothetical protein
MLQRKKHGAVLLQRGEVVAAAVVDVRQSYNEGRQPAKATTRH